MADEARLLAAIGDIYDAALVPERWPGVLERIGDLMNGSAVMFGVHAADGATSFVTSSRLDPAYMELFRARYDEPSSNQVLCGMLELPAGVPVLEADWNERDEFFRSGVYNDLIRPLGLRDGAMAVITRGADHLVPLSVMQRRNAELFGEEDRQLLQLLLPHLKRAAQIFLRIGMIEAQRGALQETLDRLPLGVVLLDAAGRVLQLNKAAEAITAAGDGLRVGRDGLQAADPGETRSLRRLVAGAAATSRGTGTAAGGAMGLSRPSGALPLSVLVAPLAGERLASGPGWPAAVVFLSDPEQKEAAPADVLVRLYSLTRAEAKLAGKLLEGKELTEAAAELGVTMNTARTHLKRVFDKTGMQRQADLVRLLLRGPAGLRPA